MSSGWPPTSAETPREDALALAAEIAGRSPHAVRGAKALFNRLANAGAAEQFAEERRVIGTLVGSPNQVEAVTGQLRAAAPQVHRRLTRGFPAPEGLRTGRGAGNPRIRQSLGRRTSDAQTSFPGGASALYTGATVRASVVPDVHPSRPSTSVDVETMPTTPGPTGLYDPRFEHDSCGVSFVANIKGVASHELVHTGLVALTNLAHRGATGAEPDTGDGAGILVQIPDRFLRAVVGEQCRRRAAAGRGLRRRHGLPPRRPAGRREGPGGDRDDRRRRGPRAARLARRPRRPDAASAPRRGP